MKEGDFMKILFAVFLVFVVGCAPMETAQVLDLGSSPFLKDGKVYSAFFQKDIPSLYEDTLEILDSWGAVKYRGSLKENFLVALSFDKHFPNKCVDTTEVAVFFDKTGENETLIKVSSLNYQLSKVVSKELFLELNRK